MLIPDMAAIAMFAPEAFDDGHLEITAAAGALVKEDGKGKVKGTR